MQKKKGCGCSSILGFLVLIVIIGNVANGCGKSEDKKTPVPVATHQATTEAEASAGSDTQDHIAKLHEEERTNVDRCIEGVRLVLGQSYGEDHYEISTDHEKGEIWIRIWYDGVADGIHQYLAGNVSDEFRAAYDIAIEGTKAMVESVTNLFLGSNVITYHIYYDIVNETDHSEVFMRFMDTDFVYDAIDGFHFPYTSESFDDLDGAEGEAYQKEMAEAMEVVHAAQDTTGNDEIEAIVKERITDYDGATIDRISINPNLGKGDGSKVVLVYFNWDVLNYAKTANPVLKMYSDDLAAYFAEQGNVSECAIFWYSTFLGKTGKWAYEKHDDGKMYLTDNIALS